MEANNNIKIKEYIPTQEEFKQLQKILLEMLIELDRICRLHNVKYSIDGGTLLGAVRHKGFIPWDDDIDVILLRSEYVKFRKACKKELDRKRFFLQDYRSDPNYRWGYEKLRRKGTEQIRLGQESLKQKTGVFLDIFVADNVPDNMVLRRIHHFLCFAIRKILYSPLGAISTKSKVMKIFYGCLSKMPRNMVFKWRNILANLSNKNRTELISHYTLEYPKSCKYGLPRKCFDEMIEMDFEGYKFYGFKEYDIYLSMHYGDYMKLPAVEDRVAHLKVSKLRLMDVEI